MASNFFDFDEYFTNFENNPVIKEDIESIIRSRYPHARFEWITNYDLQKKGIDLKFYTKYDCSNIDLKGITYAKNHNYLEDISIELVSNYTKYLSTKGKEGKSWLFKEENETDELLYYWLDSNNSVKPKIIFIEYSALREWASNFFNLYELFPFLNCRDIQSALKKQTKKTIFLGKFKGFEIFSAKNKNYFTINLKIQLKYLNDVFKQFDLEELHIIEKKASCENIISKKEKLSDFF